MVDIVDWILSKGLGLILVVRSPSDCCLHAERTFNSLLYSAWTVTPPNLVYTPRFVL